jgi:hypothetical protein
MSTRTANGRAWGYLGALLGGLVSIGANTAHSYVPPAGAPASWRPPIGAVIGAVFWPIALFVAIEILARTAWPAGARWIAVRFVGLVPVATVAAIVSYNHLSGLLAHYGEDRLTVVIGPLAVDGLMVMSSAAVMATTPRRIEPIPVTVPEPVVENTPQTPLEQLEKAAPKPRSRTPRKAARKTAPARPSEDQLLDAATALNATALAATGEPVSLRKLKTELRVGHPTAVKLRDTVIVTAPETTSPPVVQHANGTPVPTV